MKAETTECIRIQSKRTIKGHFCSLSLSRSPFRLNVVAFFEKYQCSTLLSVSTQIERWLAVDKGGEEAGNLASGDAACIPNFRQSSLHEMISIW